MIKLGTMFNYTDFVLWDIKIVENVHTPTLFCSKKWITTKGYFTPHIFPSTFLHNLDDFLAFLFNCFYKTQAPPSLHCTNKYFPYYNNLLSHLFLLGIEPRDLYKLGEQYQLNHTSELKYFSLNLPLLPPLLGTWPWSPTACIMGMIKGWNKKQRQGPRSW